MRANVVIRTRLLVEAIEEVCAFAWRDGKPHILSQDIENILDYCKRIKELLAEEGDDA